MKESEEQIIASVLNGNSKAYALLVDEYKDRVFSLVIGILHQRELAEEVAQDVFVKAYRSLSKFRKEAGFSTWIYRIAYNTAITELRKKNNLALLTTEPGKHLINLPAETSQNDEQESRNRTLHSALRQLEPDENLLVALYYFEEKSIEEVE